ncbi:hypothetical protein [Candidatus Soleaferrea massiliensis]|uniref:hypothetical protein n=1 Tax=Candidatus Soleaferrea massiliensis TaxID=1470354 RepID=UPI00058E361D|nr:hypothetical protein [Candidatus Soleaferrea massiliensis]
MQSIIKQLIELDELAREMIDQAKDQKKELIEHIDEEKAQIESEYIGRADRRLQIISDLEEKNMKNMVHAIQMRNDEMIGELQKQYEQNHQGWEDEIFNRCIGR